MQFVSSSSVKFYNILKHLYSTSKAKVMLCESESIVDTLDIWCKSWRLKMIVTKTIVVHFKRPSQDRILFNFKIGHEIIHVVEKNKYLGCTCIFNSFSTKGNIEVFANNTDEPCFKCVR